MNEELKKLNAYELVRRYRAKVSMDHYDPMCQEDEIAPDSMGTLDELENELYRRLEFYAVNSP